jgi:hypothetical protein
VSHRRVYSDAGIFKAIRHQFSALAQAPMLISRISMIQVHQGVEVEVISEVVDLPDIPPGDELSGADAYDDLDGLPFQSRAADGGRHPFSCVSDLLSERSEGEVREFYPSFTVPCGEDRPFAQSSMSADLVSVGPAREGEDIISIADTTSGPLSSTRSGTRSQSIGNAYFDNFQDDDEDLSMSVPSQQSRSQMSLSIIVSSFSSGNRSKDTKTSMSLGGISEL